MDFVVVVLSLLVVLPPGPLSLEVVVDDSELLLETCGAAGAAAAPCAPVAPGAPASPAGPWAPWTGIVVVVSLFASYGHGAQQERETYQRRSTSELFIHLSSIAPMLNVVCRRQPTGAFPGASVCKSTQGRLGIALTIFKVRRTKPVSWLRSSSSVALPTGSSLQR